MSSFRMNRANNNECRVYVGNLPEDIRVREVEDIFHKYGPIRDIELKTPRGRGAPFAFLEFEDQRDAEDAVRGRDGYEYERCRLRVEFPKIGQGRGNYDNYRGSGFNRGGSRGRARGKGRGFGPPRRSDYRVLISGLPATGSWQDVKDHMREAGDVLFTDVFKDGTGIVEFARRDDMKWAIKHLSDTKFKSHEGETSFIKVKQDGMSRSRSRSFSPRRTYGSRSRSRSDSRSYSRSRSRSRSKSKSVSSRSRSRSPKK